LVDEKFVGNHYVWHARKLFELCERCKEAASKIGDEEE
jgi:hypothetical protein